MTIRCILIDDEPLALDLLEDYVRKTPLLELKGRCSNVFSALEILEREPVDLLFIDIQMPGMSGLEFARTIKASQRCIFTTAFQEYAIDGYKVNALDYLLKPINYATFLQSVHKAQTWFDLKAKNYDEQIFVKSGHSWQQISLKNILYIENQKDYVKFVLEGKVEPILSILRMKSLENRLPSQDFMRVHRSFIVRLDKIKTIERNTIPFGKQLIPISESYKKNFDEYMHNFFIRDENTNLS